MKRFQKILPVETCQLVEDLTAVIADNNVDNFKNLFSKSINRNLTKTGLTLLQETIRLNRREIFDVLLQFQDKDDLEIRNIDGERALRYAVDHYKEHDEYYALMIIEKGASLDIEDWHSTYLHESVRSSFKVTKLLLDKGIDVDIKDRYGGTAIHEALLNVTVRSRWQKFNFGKQNNDEIIATLLWYDADPFNEEVTGYNVFENAVQYGQPDFLQEILFFYTFDEQLPGDIMFKVLLKLAKQKSPLFHKIFEYDVDFLIEHNTKKMDFAIFLRNLFALEDDYLDLLLEKCDGMICEIFENLVLFNSTPYPRTCIVGANRQYQYELVFGTNLTLQKLTLLFEKSEVVREYVVNFINILHSSELFLCISKTNSESTTTELFVYLILHGLKIETKLFESVFQKYGYCELFRLLLHTDIENDTEDDNAKHLRIHKSMMPFISATPNNQFKESVLHFICDVIPNIDLFPFPRKFKFCNNIGLLDYFACPDFYKLMSELAELGYIQDEIQKRIKNHPRIPLLTEIARNVFRRYFVNKLNITSTKQFYSLLNGLPISTAHKKIITFKTKLYNT